MTSAPNPYPWHVWRESSSVENKVNHASWLNDISLTEKGSIRVWGRELTKEKTIKCLTTYQSRIPVNWIMQIITEEFIYIENVVSFLFFSSWDSNVKIIQQQQKVVLYCPLLEITYLENDRNRSVLRQCVVFEIETALFYNHISSAFLLMSGAGNYIQKLEVFSTSIHWNTLSLTL